jgi:hypothetical protein
MGKVAPTVDEIRAVPKVLLHDHLDGGLRPGTVVDLARGIGYQELPSADVEEVARWLRRGANRGHLKYYLDAFQHTVAVMQTPEALTRVAAECAEDLADDGVVYAEVRFAPELHVAGGLTLEQVVAAVLDGFRIGSVGRNITVYALLTAMRTAARSATPTWSTPGKPCRIWRSAASEATMSAGQDSAGQGRLASRWARGAAPGAAPGRAPVPGAAPGRAPGAAVTSPALPSGPPRHWPPGRWRTRA